MTTAQLEIQLIAVIVAIACALPGVFLVLRKMAMMSDAIGHAILFGIVLGFFVVHDVSSPLLVVAAALTGILTVFLVESLYHTRLVREDAAIGLVFPLLFSIGVILISRYAGDIHLDVDSVLLGELAFAPFDRLVISDYDLGPRAVYLMSAILILNVIFIALFYKELKLASFDAGMAAAAGFSPVLIHYSLMSLVSLTAVGAFDAVGAVLVVALMIAPPAAAYLLTNRLSLMLLLSAVIAVFSAISGYWLANSLDVNIAGAMATMTGVVFVVVLLFAPFRGLFAIARRKSRQRIEFAQKMLAVHLLNHQGKPEEQERECHLKDVHEHLRWEKEFAMRIAQASEKEGLLQINSDILTLTSSGLNLARKSMVE
ncbi:MAG: metal ABC transporter permease [Calditrichota bacterium]